MKEKQKNIDLQNSSIEETSPMTDETSVNKDTELEDTENTSKRKKIAAFVISGIVALSLLGAGLAFARNKSSEPEPYEIEVLDKKKEEKSLESNLLLTLDKQGTQEVIVDATVEITNDKDEAYIKEREIELDKQVNLGSLSEGAYSLLLRSAPIEIDGSSYILPKEATTLTVDGKGEDIEITIELERLDVSDMTKEQLEAVAAIIEEKAPEHTELAESLKDKAQDATSEPESAKELKVDTPLAKDDTPKAAAPDTPSSNSSSSNSSSSSSTSTGSTISSNNTAPSVPSHTHSYTIPITETNQVWVVDLPAYSYEKPIYGSVCNGCGANITGFAGQHLKDSGRGGVCQSYREDVIGYETVNVPESGHYENQTVTVGYKCSCGAVA